jgi:poly [ADP-ribose] polymerase
MAEMIEVAKTGRARCRSCRQAVEKGTLRFGEETPSAFGEGMQWGWYHLACAARKRPLPFRTALAAFEGEVPERAELEQALSEAEQSVVTLPYAEHAPTGRSKCLGCSEPIAKGALRVAVEREVEMGAMTRAGAGYLHPACAPQHGDLPDLLAQLRKNSKRLSEADLAELASAIPA